MTYLERLIYGFDRSLSTVDFVTRGKPARRLVR